LDQRCLSINEKFPVLYEMMRETLREATGRPNNWRKTMQVFLFPGQGSQQRGMGGGLFDEVREYVELEPQVDALLGYSLRTLCLEDPDKRLTNTQFTQPALYVVNALHYYKALADGMKPSAVAGHSLGEYSALLAAGAFDFLTGLRLVQKRGELMARARNGSMTAIVGIDALKIASALREHALTSIDIANYNAPLQTVISGPVDDLKRAAPRLEAAGASMCAPLPVSAAFHSRYMESAAKEFEEFLRGFDFRQLQLRVVANVTGRPYTGGDPNATVRYFLVKQMSESVKWTHGIRFLLDEGATDFKEIGPGTVLTRLIGQIKQPV
jgi:malonyl CoA-acyl carrier protein transacylase